MATSHQTQMTTSHFLTPFTIARDCPKENRENIYRIIIILKNNLFKETKHIQQVNIHRNHLAHYLPLIQQKYNNRKNKNITNSNISYY